MASSILVVAQASPERSALIARLQTQGYLVVPADERREAREILQTMALGAVFVDLSMPDRQGRLLVDDLDASPRLRMMPRLVALGAWRRNTRPVSGAAVFVKPLDLDHVIRTMRAVYPAVGDAPITSQRASATQRICRVDLHPDAPRSQETRRAVLDADNRRHRGRWQAIAADRVPGGSRAPEGGTRAAGAVQGPLTAETGVRDTCRADVTADVHVGRQTCTSHVTSHVHVHD
jgi:DNA-binding response OmpR family regulator